MTVIDPKTAVPRPVGRVVLVDSLDRVLLLRCEDPSIDQPILWLTPGGACEAGESLEQAAIRELWEETGIRSTKLGPCVWRRRHVWRWGNRMIDSHETYYFWRCHEEVSIDRTGFTRFEREVIREHRWWSVTELQQAHGEVFVPRGLPQFIVPLLRGEFPVEPLDVGT